MQSHDIIEPLMTLAEMARVLGRTPVALRTIRARDPQRLPPAIKLGNRLYWRPETVRQWLSEHEEVRG